jgi:serine/threonine protein kinase
MVDNLGNIKLLDFSTAKILGENGSIPEGTDKFFNPDHCSPEQMFQKEYYLNSDVWMLGTIFIELMIPEEHHAYPLDS